MNKILSEIRKIIALHADRTALTDTQGSSLTYAELDLLARRIAARLIKLGVEPGSFVTVELPRSIEYIAAQLGVWYAGAAYAPLGLLCCGGDKRKIHARHRTGAACLRSCHFRGQQPCGTDIHIRLNGQTQGRAARFSQRFRSGLALQQADGF